MVRKVKIIEQGANLICCKPESLHELPFVHPLRDVIHAENAERSIDGELDGVCLGLEEGKLGHDSSRGERPHPERTKRAVSSPSAVRRPPPRQRTC
jgi:hypothetical protein